MKYLVICGITTPEGDINKEAVEVEASNFNEVLTKLNILDDASIDFIYVKRK